jgi:hypothetical protein
VRKDKENMDQATLKALERKKLHDGLMVVDDPEAASAGLEKSVPALSMNMKKFSDESMSAEDEKGLDDGVNAPAEDKPPSASARVDFQSRSDGTDNPMFA